jgi:hypothetical protein
MVAPTLLFTDCCFGKIPYEDEKMVDRGAPKKLGNHCFLIAPIADALISLTALIVGILGAVSVIAMPAAAAYTLIGISCAITLAWIAMVVYTCCMGS